MDLKTLKKNRGSYKSKLTIFKTFLQPLLPCKELNPLQTCELTARLTKIQDVYNDFDSAQTEIENFSEIPGDEFPEREAFENSYFSVVAAAQELLERSQAASAAHDDQVTGSSGVSAHMRGPNIKLPIINLPTFSGSYQDWLEYHDTFKSLIHSNTSIPKINKFHYLRASLKESASLIIQSLDFTVENYDVAWSLLCDRYNNNRLLVNNHIQALFNIEQIQRESSQTLRTVIDTVNKNLRALKTLNLPTEHWDILIIHMVLGKLDQRTMREWEVQRNNLKEFPSLLDFNSFLKNRADLLETMEDTYHKPPRRHSDTTHTRQKSLVTNESPSNHSNAFACPLCKGHHAIYHCTKFKSLPIEKRIERVNQLKLCKNCLRRGHDEQHCKLSTCKMCSQKHNTLLHNPNTAEHRASTSSSKECVVLPATQKQARAEEQSTENITLSSIHHSQVLLSTAIVNISDGHGQLHKVRVLLDNGSTSSFITKGLQQQLGIPTYSTSITVQGLSNQSSQVTQRCDVTISSLSNTKFTTELNCFVVPQITQIIPSTRVNCKSFTIPPHIHLADPTFHTPSEVQLLLGADLFWEVLAHNTLSLGKSKPTLVETSLGWLVSGSVPVKQSQRQPNTVHTHFIKTIELEEQLNKFFEFESVSTTQQTQTKGESECEEIFTNTTIRQPDGRFVVHIPLKESPTSLGDSKQQALVRFQTLERKFKRNPSFKTLYKQFMHEYITLGHMTENPHTDTDEVTYFLPHHGILRENSLSTKLRTVFDASAVTSSGKSFNNIQHVGPIVQEDLISILIRFRQHKYVVTADIEKMYRQILIDERFRPLQQIFWRPEPDQEIKQYKLNTVTYGTASAPYLATRCLVQLGRECTNKNAQQTILHDMYVDDLITGSDSESELIKTCKGVIQTLEGAHFHLRKWRSNAPSILTQIVDENSNDQLLTINKENYAKTLGLLWTCTHDMLFSSTNTDTQTYKQNKRTILSTIAQVFDPLGLINPCMLQAKLILQTLWSTNLSWDDELPSEIISHWQNFIANLPNIAHIQIPRRVLCDSHIKIELHAFSDASIKAYSGCIYIRSISSNGNVSVHLLLAKSKVAPLKQRLTVPRLELLGALLASKLAEKVKNSLRIKIDKQFYWCDSTIVLGWIKTCKHQLKQFVYNRVNEITLNSEPHGWHYIPTHLNPADIGSRGLNATQLKSSSLWWEGPRFLHEAEFTWPTQVQIPHTNELPETKIQCNFMSSDSHDFTSKYSSFAKLQRIVAYIMRFKHNCQTPTNKTVGTLTISELENSTQSLCRIVQMKLFYKQYTQLITNHQLSSKDKILNLNPFLETETNLIRVGGRLANSNLDYNTKHPILLHASHHISQLLVEHYHKCLLHAGPQLLLASLRQRFWIVNGRNLARKITRNCTRCCRFSGRTYQPIMSHLHKSRLHGEFVFLNTSVDYCGPILIADRKGRGCRLKKAYICIFVCMAVRAVHIELVTELTSQGFIAALNRFTARRGKPANIHSDNGTNFVGACNELSKFIKSTSNDIVAYSSENEINFKFSPAYSPHFNGLAEASVKSIKFHLKRVLGMAHLDYEEMNTVLVQIESILNSRPLTPLSSDPSDLIPLTPAHFLIGRSITTLPTPQVQENVAISALTRYMRIQALKQHFWKRFYNEYVSELQIRTKWRKDKGQPQLGDMVLVKDDRLPPLRWLLGRVIAVYPGDDGIHRVADVLTTSGTMRRAFNRLCPLPTLEQNVPRPAACLRPA